MQARVGLRTLAAVLLLTAIAMQAGVAAPAAPATQSTQSNPSPPAVVEGAARVMTNQLGALTRATPRGRLEPVDVYFSGAALRMEFKDNRGSAYAMIIPKDATVGWVTDGKGAIPLPRAQRPLLLDTAQPCAGGGMFADCRQLGTGVVAGRRAARWRYRLPANTGPGGTRQGEMWLDVETGLLLAYKGTTGLGPVQEWRVESVDYRPLPADLFAVPENLLQPTTTRPPAPARL